MPLGRKRVIQNYLGTLKVCLHVEYSPTKLKLLMQKRVVVRRRCRVVNLKLFGDFISELIHNTPSQDWILVDWCVETQAVSVRLLSLSNGTAKTKLAVFTFLYCQEFVKTSNKYIMFPLTFQLRFRHNNFFMNHLLTFLIM